jgi:hypothetical protein
MVTIEKGFRMRRRQILQAAMAVPASWGVSSSGLGQVCPPKAGTVRDRLWVFCNPRNADYDVVRKRSVMSPLEGAVYFGVPNILMVNQYPEGRAESLPGQAGWFEPFEPPFEQYALALNVLKRVAWSIVGAGGVTKDWERKQVLDMALHTPNFVGVYMDDFFRSKPEPAVASLTLEELRAIQQQLKGSPKKLDLFVTFYTQFLNRPIREYLNLIDVVVMWTGHVKNLTNLKANLALLAKLAPKSRKMLGCYTAEYNENRVPAWTGMPVPAMQHQCEVALRCLREGQIEGIVIYGCTAEDLGWESVNWTREWIQKVGDIRL